MIDTPTRLAPPRAAVLLLVLLLASLAGRVVFALWEGPFDGSIDWADASRPGFWWMNLYLGGPSYTVSFVAAAVFLVLLGRSSALACLAGVLVGLGGIVFGAVITAEVLPFAFAVDPAVLPEVAGRELVEGLNGRLDLLLPTILGTTVVVAVGGLLGLVATLRARTAPGWFAPAAITAVVVSQLLPQVGLTVVGYLVETAALAGIGWFGTRAAAD
ncbi:hypothetical protein SAMN05660199_03206 [Klenkia soli]|uniref:Uncharacterized protein n=1 Tax=Klenkia soli TaxID=1052260 RepID=A0A1H0Q4S9_9ACTN|nr:hypothetical protein [Klenkia soli]SDP12120.1 hypothetical protein SAMN05660199_03206 [Klenkia soli]